MAVYFNEKLFVNMFRVNEHLEQLYTQNLVRFSILRETFHVGNQFEKRIIKAHGWDKKRIAMQFRILNEAEPDETLPRLYMEGVNAELIAEKFGTDPRRLINRLEDLGVVEARRGVERHFAQSTAALMVEEKLLSPKEYRNKISDEIKRTVTPNFNWSKY